MAKNYTVALNMKYLELANPQKQKADSWLPGDRWGGDTGSDYS